MSGHYYPQQTTPSEGDDDFEFNRIYQTQPHPNVQANPSYQRFLGQTVSPPMPQGQGFNNPQSSYQQPPQSLRQQQLQLQPQYQQTQQHPRFNQPPQYQGQYNYQAAPVTAFVTPTVPSNYPREPQTVTPFPAYSESATRTPRTASTGPSGTSAGYLSPDEASRPRVSRSTSFASIASSGGRSYSHSDVSTRSVSPNADEMQRWGYRNDNGTWSCRYPECSSKSTFGRGCDLRKHYKRHTKSLFCRIEGCPQASEGGFSSKKDRARHESKHNPNIVCEWEGCDRLFSRTDNMKDHLRRVHRRQQR